MLTASGRLLVLDPAEDDDDLVREVTEILTSLLASPHAVRAGTGRAARAVGVAFWRRR